MSGRNPSLRRELNACAEERNQLRTAVPEICSCVLGTPPSSPLPDDLQKVPGELAALTTLAAYHGASSALSAMVLRHPELELGGLFGEPSAGWPYDNVLVVAKKLEPIAAKIAQGLPFAAVGNRGAGAMADASSTGGSVVPSSGLDPSLQK